VAAQVERAATISFSKPGAWVTSLRVILLFDIGNTNTHIGLANGQRVLKQGNIPTAEWQTSKATRMLARFVGKRIITGAAICSVVPSATPRVKIAIRAFTRIPAFELSPCTLRGVGIDYPKPDSIGPDRLANAVAARMRFGVPVVVVDFGTAVTFDVVDARGNYVGGIIAPGLAAMTDYLHEKTALLPRIRIRAVHSAIGKSTRHAMLAGAVLGYRGLVRELISRLRNELGARTLPVIATGGYAALIAQEVTEISAIAPGLTLEGLLEVWRQNQS
jgi:type III pantothenate kinase